MMKWLNKNKISIVIGIMFLAVMLLGRWCAPDREDPQIDMLQQANVELQAKVHRSDVRVDSIYKVLDSVKDSVRFLERENTVQTERIRSTVRDYERKIVKIKELTVEQVDSAFVARYPGLEESEMKKFVIEELVEGDKNREIVFLQRRKLNTQSNLILIKDDVISSLESIIKEKNFQLKLKQGEVDNLNKEIKLKDKKLRKAKWERNGIVGIAGVLLLIIVVL